MIVLALLLVFSVYSLHKSKRHSDSFYPLTIYCIPFTIQYIVYLSKYAGSNQVGSSTLTIYISSIVVFVIAYGLFEKLFMNSIEKDEKSAVVLSTNMLRIIAIITLFVLFAGVGVSVISRGLDSFYREMRYQMNYGEGTNALSKYLPVLFNTYFIMWLVSVSEKDKMFENRRTVAIYVIVYFVIAFFSFSRTNLLMALCSFMYCLQYNNRVNQRKTKKTFKSRIVAVMIIIVVLQLFSWIATATNKTGNSDWDSSDFYVWKYLGYPLVTMDRYAINYPGLTSGTYSLGIVGKVLKSIGLIRSGDTSVLPQTGQFNVFSYIGNVYLDFGSLFFIAHIIIAMIVAFLYVKNKKCGGIWTAMYSFYSYAIIISFYSFQYSLTLYIYILIILFAIKKMFLDQNIKSKARKGEGL